MCFALATLLQQSSNRSVSEDESSVLVGQGTSSADLPYTQGNLVDLPFNERIKGGPHLFHFRGSGMAETKHGPGRHEEMLHLTLGWLMLLAASGPRHLTAALVIAGPSRALVLTEPGQPQALSNSISQLPRGRDLGPDLHLQSKTILGLQQATWPAPFMNHLITKALR